MSMGHRYGIDRKETPMDRFWLREACMITNTPLGIDLLITTVAHFKMMFPQTKKNELLGYLNALNIRSGSPLNRTDLDQIMTTPASTNRRKRRGIVEDTTSPRLFEV